MHIQAVDMQNQTAVCPECRVIQNVDVVSHDEEQDLLAGQRCWYCGQELQGTQLQDGGDFKVVLSGDDAPAGAEPVAVWEAQLEHQFGGKPVGFNFDYAGRCIVKMHPVTTAGDLDVPAE